MSRLTTNQKRQPSPSNQPNQEALLGLLASLLNGLRKESTTEQTTQHHYSNGHPTGNQLCATHPHPTLAVEELCELLKQPQAPRQSAQFFPNHHNQCNQPRTAETGTPFQAEHNSLLNMGAANEGYWHGWGASTPTEDWGRLADTPGNGGSGCYSNYHNETGSSSHCQSNEYTDQGSNSAGSSAGSGNEGGQPGSSTGRGYSSGSSDPTANRGGSQEGTDLGPTRRPNAHINKRDMKRSNSKRRSLQAPGSGSSQPPICSPDATSPLPAVSPKPKFAERGLSWSRKQKLSTVPDLQIRVGKAVPMESLLTAISDIGTLTKAQIQPPVARGQATAESGDSAIQFLDVWMGNAGDARRVHKRLHGTILHGSLLLLFLQRESTRGAWMDGVFFGLDRNYPKFTRLYVRYSFPPSAIKRARTLHPVDSDCEATDCLLYTIFSEYGIVSHIQRIKQGVSFVKFVDLEGSLQAQQRATKEHPATIRSVDLARPQVPVNYQQNST